MHYPIRNIHLDFLRRARFNLGKMFTPPKSKSPWEAMTAGSSGGWAKGVEPWGPAITAVSGAIPVVGPFIAAGLGAAGAAGKGTGFQGTDYGNANWGSTALGALSGWGLGGLGAGAAGAVGGALKGGANALLPGFTKGMSGYMSATGAPFSAAGKAMFGSGAATNAFGAGNAFTSTGLGGMSGYTGPLASGGTFGAGSSVLAPELGAASGLFGMNGAGATSAVGGVGSVFNLNNMLNSVLSGGSGSQILSAALGLGGGAPQLRGNRESALSAINTPDLVQARGMIRDVAMMNPSEILSPASDAYLNATLRAHREGVEKQKKEALNLYGSKGQIAGKSGAVDKYLRETDKAALQRESDYIATVNESRMLAATKMKIDAVQQYYNISADQAAQYLAAEGYVNPIDAQNYLATLQEYQTQQMLQGYMQLAPYLRGRA